MISADAASSGSDVQVQRVDVERLFQRSRDRLVHEHLGAGSVVSTVATSGARRDHLLEVVEHDEVVATGAGECDGGRVRGRSPRSRTPKPRAIAGSASDSPAPARGRRTCTRSNASRGGARPRGRGRVLPIPPAPTSVMSLRGSPAHPTSRSRRLRRPARTPGPVPHGANLGPRARCVQCQTAVRVRRAGLLPLGPEHRL